MLSILSVDLIVLKLIGFFSAAFNQKSFTDSAYCLFVVFSFSETGISGDDNGRKFKSLIR